MEKFLTADFAEKTGKKCDTIKPKPVAELFGLYAKLRPAFLRLCESEGCDKIGIIQGDEYFIWAANGDALFALFEDGEIATKFVKFDADIWKNTPGITSDELLSICEYIDGRIEAEVISFGFAIRKKRGILHVLFHAQGDEEHRRQMYVYTHTKTINGYMSGVKQLGAIEFGKRLQSFNQFDEAFEAEAHRARILELGQKGVEWVQELGYEGEALTEAEIEEALKE